MYEWLKFIHIISAFILFGTGLGTAYYLWRAHLTGDPAHIAMTARHVVAADWMFTTPTVIIQPLSGLALVYVGNFSLTMTWLWLALVLYAVAGLCWLPVVWIQIKVKKFAEFAVEHKQALPPLYFRYMRLWILLGIPAFSAMLVIVYLMVVKYP